MEIDVQKNDPMQSTLKDPPTTIVKKTNAQTSPIHNESVGERPQASPKVDVIIHDRSRTKRFSILSAPLQLTYFLKGVGCRNLSNFPRDIQSSKYRLVAVNNILWDVTAVLGLRLMIELSMSLLKYTVQQVEVTARQLYSGLETVY